MADMMKAMGCGKRGPMAGLANMLGFGGGMPMPTPEEMAKLAEKMPGGCRRRGLPPSMPGLPPKFPGDAGPAAARPRRRQAGRRGFPGLGKKK